MVNFFAVLAKVTIGVTRFFFSPFVIAVPQNIHMISSNLQKTFLSFPNIRIVWSVFFSPSYCSVSMVI